MERRGRHLALTRKGEARSRSFGVAMAELRSGLAEVAEWLGRTGGRIVIGAMPLSRARWLPRAIVAFKRVRPDVELAVIEGRFSELSGPLREGEIDLLLGALRGENPQEDLAQELSFVDRPKIAMRADHPLAEAGSTSADKLRRYPWALPPIQTRCGATGTT